MNRQNALLGAGAVVIAAAALCVLKPAAAQLGGLEGLQPFGQSASGEQLIQSGRVNGPSLFILIAPDRSRVWGYSTANGKWAEISLEGGDANRPPRPIVGGMVAALADGQRVHAFSALNGTWDTLDVPEGARAQPVVGSDYAYVRTRSSLSIFSGRTGNWATVEFGRAESDDAGAEQPAGEDDQAREQQQGERGRDREDRREGNRSERDAA